MRLSVLGANCVRMKHVIGCWLALWFFCSPLFAQFATPSHGIYLEVANRAAPYSLNYERTFHAGKQLAWAFRTGVSATSKALAVPLGLHAWTAPRKDHHLEFSLGVQPYIRGFQTLFRADGATDTYLYLVPGIGYRYQAQRTPWFARVAAHPMVFMDPPATNVWEVNPSWMLGASLAVGIRL